MNKYSQKPLFAASLMLFIILLNFPSIVHTKEIIPTDDSIFEKVGDIGEQNASKKGLTTPVNETIKINNQTILFTESLYDGSSIHLAYLIKSSYLKDGIYKANRFIDEIEVTKNGAYLFINGMSAGGELLENGDYAGIITVDFHERILDSFMLGIKFRHNDSVLAEIPIRLKGKAKSFEINETKSINKKEITYDKITFYPTATEIQIQNIIDEEFKHRHIDINLRVIDDKGRILQPLRAEGTTKPIGNGKLKLTSSYYFEPLDPIPNSLRIQPYLVDFKNSNKPEDVKKKWKGNDFTLPQGDAGYLRILDVKEEEGIVRIKYEINGKQDFQQATTLWVEDVEGNHYGGDYPPKQLGKNKFQLTFLIGDQPKEYYIATAKLEQLNYVKELETTVEFKD